MTWIIIGIVVLLAIIGAVANNNNLKKSQETDTDNLRKKGVDVEQMISIGKYRGGHPSLDSYLPKVKAYSRNGEFELYSTSIDKDNKNQDIQTTSYVASIPKSGIKNIIIEDATTIEKRLSVGNILLFGPVGLAMRKKDVNESAYITIEWNDGRFDHSTIFQAVNMQEANKTRNGLIRLVNQENLINE